jgi:hypothetical protein
MVSLKKLLDEVEKDAVLVIKVKEEEKKEGKISKEEIDKYLELLREGKDFQVNNNIFNYIKGLISTIVGDEDDKKRKIFILSLVYVILNKEHGIKDEKKLKGFLYEYFERLRNQ